MTLGGARKWQFFGNLQYYLCWRRWVGGPKKAKNMLTSYMNDPLTITMKGDWDLRFHPEHHVWGGYHLRLRSSSLAHVVVGTRITGGPYTKAYHVVITVQIDSIAIRSWRGRRSVFSPHSMSGSPRELVTVRVENGHNVVDWVGSHSRVLPEVKVVEGLGTVY